MMDFREILVSGSPSAIYGLPCSLFELHDIVMQPDRARDAGIHHLFELYGSAYYRHTATPEMMVDLESPWTAALLESHNREQHCHAAASVVLRIEDATIDASVVYCRKDERVSILYESFRFPDRPAAPISAAAMAQPDFALSVQGKACLYIGSSGSFNYGHWLVDDLPRAKAWIELKRRSGIRCTILLPRFGTRVDDIKVQSLHALIDPLIEIVFIPANEPFRVSDLYYATPVSFHPRIKTPSALNFVRSCASSLLPSGHEEPQRRLFVARRPPNSRSIVNFEELSHFLSRRGFELVEAEQLDFIQQVALFAGAQIVVGQMGAAMTNTLFCSPGTNLVYLTPAGWAEPFYLDLAALSGHQYNILTGPTTQDVPPYLSDFHVPLDNLYHRMKFMGFEEASVPA